MRRSALPLAVLAVVSASAGLSACAAPRDRFTGTWYGPDGRPSERGQRRDHAYEVRADVGPDHCDLQSVVWLHVGWPLGTTVSVAPGSAPADSREYVRDADGVLDAAGAWPPDALDLDAVLPEPATPTGYRTDDVELWFGPDGGDLYAYLRTPSAVERWPRDTEGIACG